MKTDEDRNKWLLFWHPAYREYWELVLHGRACNFAGLDPVFNLDNSFAKKEKKKLLNSLELFSATVCQK